MPEWVAADTQIITPWGKLVLVPMRQKCAIKAREYLRKCEAQEPMAAYTGTERNATAYAKRIKHQLIICTLTDECINNSNQSVYKKAYNKTSCIKNTNATKQLLHDGYSIMQYDARESHTKQWADLVEVAFVHCLCNVTDLAALVSFPLLFIELLCQCLQFGQGHLQGQTVAMTHRCVLQHVLMRLHREVIQLSVIH